MVGLFDPFGRRRQGLGLRKPTGRLDEGAEQAHLPVLLRMPLDADDEAATGHLDCFDDALSGAGDDDQPRPETCDRLMVRATHVGGGPEDPCQAAPLVDRDTDLAEAASPGLVPVVAKAVWKMLDEIAAARDVEDLDPPADGEHGHVPVERRGKQSQLRGVPVGTDCPERRVRLSPVARRGDIGSPGQHQAVQAFEERPGTYGGDGVLARRAMGARCRRWEQHRLPPSCFDHLEVGRLHDGRTHVPRAPSRLLQIGGDTDQRRLSHESSSTHPVQ